ncbi:alpha/beta hydrolase [Clostridioides difficile]|uniref:alpha/beta hydrolase n=1 Tax=Clostridioides difficile TaxID=1496 RepID=UPI001F4170BF|nr:alpha/beta hydrolase [Clostridioides difficile]
MGAGSKILLKPSWSKEYEVELTDKIATLHADLSYGDKQENKFDMYLPADNTRDNYGLVVYLHAGGFTSGDKADDKQMLSWLCSKGYVAIGINYTLFSEENPNANVYTQSLEIKEAIPKVIEEAEKQGYNINEMAIGGGSAGHALAMIYAYIDVDTSPVPVKLLFGAVGPSSFYAEDWDIYGFDKDTEKAKEGASALFGTMARVELTPVMIENGSYIDKLKPISAVMWVNKNTVPSVVAYGKYDKAQPFKGSQRLLKAYKENNIDYQYFECPHSGHGLQNDSKIYKKYMETVTQYLDKYLPIEK